MVIYAPKPRPVASGFWTFCDQTGDLRHVDAHADSTVCTHWPLLDRWHRNLIERGVDWLLNAAGAGRERLDAALRVPYPGSRLDRLPAIQSAFWYRLLQGLSGGDQAQLFLGDGEAGSRGGLIVDDSKDATTVTGWPGSTDNASSVRGEGPGGGHYQPGDNGGYSRGGCGGGAAEAGSSGSGSAGDFAGRVVPSVMVLEAIITNSYVRENWLTSGGGGGNRAGGASGDGLLRVGAVGLTETTSRMLQGSNGRGASGRQHRYHRGAGGGGGGGAYLALVGRDYTLASGVTIDCAGGSGGSSADGEGRGGAGGNGRMIVCYGDSVDTSAGTITDAEPTTYQLLPSLPLGQVLVS